MKPFPAQPTLDIRIPSNHYNKLAAKLEDTVESFLTDLERFLKNTITHSLLDVAGYRLVPESLSKLPSEMEEDFLRMMEESKDKSWKIIRMNLHKVLRMDNFVGDLLIHFSNVRRADNEDVLAFANKLRRYITIIEEMSTREILNRLLIHKLPKRGQDVIRRQLGLPREIDSPISILDCMIQQTDVTEGTFQQ
ncbi:hypothetical protein BGW38_009189, partial [Lunasporangiospora selenospora]